MPLKSRRSQLERPLTTAALAASLLAVDACGAGPPVRQGARSQELAPGVGLLDRLSRTPPTSGAIDPGTTGPTVPAGAADRSDWEVALAPIGAGKGRLIIFFPGSGANPGGYMKIMQVWQGAGYHVLGVTVKAEAAGLNRNCPPSKRTTEPQCFDAFRAESAFGSGTRLPDGEAGLDSPYLAIEAGASTANRTFALLDHVIRTQPGNGWPQFRSGPCATVAASSFCTPDWRKVTLAGHS